MVHDHGLLDFVAGVQPNTEHALTVVVQHELPVAISVGDNSAYVRLGRDAAGILYVEVDLQRRDSSQIVADGGEHVWQLRSDRLGLERSTSPSSCFARSSSGLASRSV